MTEDKRYDSIEEAAIDYSKGPLGLFCERGVSDEQLREHEAWARKYGAANCWTGNEGPRRVLELIKEVTRLREQLAIDPRRLKALEELAEQAQELDMGY